MNRIIGLFIFFLLFMGLEFYLYRVFRVYFLQKPVTLRVFTIIWFLIPIACVVLSLLAPNMGKTGKLLVTNLVMIFFLVILLTAILVFLGDVTRFIINRISKPSTEVVSLGRRKMLANVGLVLMAVPLGTLLFGLFKTAYDFKIHRITLKFPNLPDAFKGFKFVQLSDIHTGSFLKHDELGEAIQLTLNEKPDVVFFTGDIVNNKTEEAYPFMEALKKLQAPMGVYSSLGNHDYGDYEKWPSTEAKAANMDAMYQLHKDLGWNLLNNENSILEKNGEKIAIVGVENWGASFRFPKKGDVTKAKKGTEDIPFKILLSHDPSHWDAQVLKDHKDMDLMLAGHTHGFQFGIEIPGIKWSPSQWLYKQWAGLYQSGSQFLYVNRGLGCLGYSGRIGIRPEITLIELQKG
jgi:predicted MPP superfamily phosphohydrolase